jgi:hypothetical protein
LRNLGIAPCFEANQGAKIVMLDCPWTLPSGNHEPTIEHLAWSLLSTTFYSFTTRMADKIFPTHLRLQSDSFLYPSCNAAMD